VKSKLINHNPKTFTLVFQTGDEVVEGLMQFAKAHRLAASQLTAIGAFDELTVGFFNPEKKHYNKILIREILIREQVEVLSFLGDIAAKDGEPQLHAHVVVGKADATAHGGHLIRGVVRPTLEVVLVESPKHLHRTPDAETGLALINLDE
jgi:predicted DNA-binding protein with PD1-like motif